MQPSVLVVIGMFSTALAQVLLKKASFYDVKTAWWLTFFGASGAMYVMSFVLYAYILKFYPLNKIYPVLTVGQILLVTFFGVLLGEVVATRHAVGLLFGVVAIYLILT